MLHSDQRWVSCAHCQVQPYILHSSQDSIGSQQLLLNAEVYGQYVATSLMSSSVDTGNQTEIKLIRDNIGECKLQYSEPQEHVCITVCFARQHQGRRSRSGWSGQNRTTFLDLKMIFGDGRYI